MAHVGLLVALAVGVAIVCWVILAMVFMSRRRTGDADDALCSRFKPPSLPLLRRPRHNVHDEEANLRGADVNDFLSSPPPPTRETMDQHPPVYCVEDLEIPPPAYRSSHERRPSMQELYNLKIRLERLKRMRAGAETSAYDLIIRQDEIRHLTEWIRKLEGLRHELSVRMVSEDEQDDDVCLEQVDRSRPMVVQRETGWVGIGLPREVRPRLDERENTLVVRRSSEPPRTYIGLERLERRQRHSR